MKLHSSTFINILFTVIWGKRIPCLTSVQMGERDLEKEKEMFLLTRHLNTQTWKKNLKRKKERTKERDSRGGVLHKAAVVLAGGRVRVLRRRKGRHLWTQ